MRGTPDLCGHSGIDIVSSEAELGALVAQLFSAERTQVVVGLSMEPHGSAPVIEPREARAVVGTLARLCFIPSARLLSQLNEQIGQRLGLCDAAVRVWWPGLFPHSDPFDHPLVLAGCPDDQPDAIAELALQFDLSRPRVRREIKLIADCLSFAELRLRQANADAARSDERLRDALIERRREAARADTAEIRLQLATQRLRSLTDSTAFRNSR